MGSRRYRTLRVWHNTLLMVWALPILLLPGVIAAAYAGRFGLLTGLGVVGVVGLLIANIRDRRKTCSYSIEGDRLTLIRNGVARTIDMPDVSDASLIDRSAAREYLREWSTGAVTDLPSPEWVAGYANYCTVDIGLTSFTLGLGRALIDRVPNGRTDLVLLRLRTGEAFLLSPIHSQDLVENISRRKIQGAHN